MPKGQYERESLESRLLKQIVVNDTTGCWVFQGVIDKDGYGQISDKCKTQRVHRRMYEIKYGTIPDGMICGHLCDEKYPADCKLYRKCCNPEHLKPMTHKENLERASALGRLPATPGAFTSNQTGGENNVKAKLTGEKVIEIRRKASTAGYGDLGSLATEYGIQYQTLYKIVKGKLWNKPQYFPQS